MIKAGLVSIGVLIVCFLENIGHYFGFCFHGFTAQIVGAIGAVSFGLAIYAKNIQIWLLSRKEGTPHKCKDHNHQEDICN